MNLKLNLIYSESIDGIIGVKNDLYCMVPSDLKMFQQVTSLKYNNRENAIIMGYNTWKSIKRPLKNRINIVISKNHLSEMKEVEDVLCFESFQNMVNFLETIEYGKLFVIGGGKLFDEINKHYFDSVDLIYQTLILDDNPPIVYSERDDVSYSSIPLIKYMREKKLTNIKSLKKSGEGKIFDFQKEEYVSGEITSIENIYQKAENVNDQEYQYLNLLESILKDGSRKESRNSTVYSSFGSRMKFDLRKGFPLLTTKKMPWKTILRELLWFVKGSTDNKALQEKNVHIWDGNASKEFLKTRGLDTYEEGDLGPIYGFQWRHFGAEYIDKIGCSSEISQFGIVNPEGELITIQENSTNLLILDFTDAVDSNNNSRITISVSENGNVLNFENKTVTNDLYINKYMRVNSEPCK